MTFSITLLACYTRAIVRLFEHIPASPDSFQYFGQILFVRFDDCYYHLYCIIAYFLYECDGYSTRYG